VNPKSGQLEHDKLLKVPLRIILSEIDERDLLPLTQYPSPDTTMPSNLRPSQPLAENRLQDSSVTESASLLSLQVGNVGQFGELAQVVSFLDRILCITRCSTEIKHNRLLKLTELAELDSEIRSFLAVIMQEDSQNRTSQAAIPTTVALCMR
jgi:hypothetical protein